MDEGGRRFYVPPAIRAGRAMSFSTGSLRDAYTNAMSMARTLLFAALLLAAAGVSSEGRAQSCVSGHEARAVLEQGQAVPLPVALQRAGISPDQLAGGAQLCQAGGGFVYRVRIVQDGQVSSVSIPAN